MPENAKLIRPQNQVILIGGVSALVALGMLALLRTTRKEKPIVSQQFGGLSMEAFNGTPAPSPTPQPEWQRMSAAFLKAHGVFLTTTYPRAPGTWRIWRDGSLWRDETPRRVYGFDGKQEWVWLPGERKVLTWQPGRSFMGALKHPGENYYVPNVVRAAYSDQSMLGRQKITREAEGDAWSLDDLQQVVARLTLNPTTHLPTAEEGKARNLRRPPARPELFRPATGEKQQEVTDWSQPEPTPFFILFPRYGAVPGRMLNKIPMQQLFSSAAFSTAPELPSATHAAYATQISYGVLPKEGFSPPRELPRINLDSLTKEWTERLTKSALVNVPGPHFEAVVRHVSQDSLGNVYLLYTGDPLEPEVYRPQRVLTLDIPGYSAARPMVNLNAILPEYIGGKKLRLLTLVPLKRSANLPKTLTLRWSDTPRNDDGQTATFTLPITQEPAGPEYLTLISGPPTLEKRQKDIAEIVHLAAVRAGDRVIDLKTAEFFEAIVRETWVGEPPWQVQFWLAQLQRSAKQNKKAYEHAYKAYERGKQANPTGSEPGIPSQLDAVRSLLSALAI